MIQWNFEMKKLCWKTITKLAKSLANWTEQCSAKSQQTSQKKAILYYTNTGKIEIFNVLQ